MERKYVFGVKYRSPPPETGLSRFRSGFFAAFMLAAALFFAGCDILNKLGITPGDDGGTDKPAVIVPVAFDGITVDNSATTTSLTLVLDRDIPGLGSGDITLASETLNLEGITVDGLFGDGTGTYILALSGVDRLGEAAPGEPGALRNLGEIAVGVSRGGYNISPASRPAAVYYDEPIKDVKFEGVTAADGAADTAVTTSLTLTFGEKIPGFSADNITIYAGSTGAKKGVLSGEGSSYTLGISDVTAAGEISVIVNKSGYSIDPPSQPVRVHYPAAVFQSVTADGKANEAATTALTLTFDKAVGGLTADDITLSGVSGITKGELTGSGPSYTLAVGGFKAEGTLTVAVNREGDRIDESAPKTVAVHVNKVSFSSVTATGALTTIQLTLAFDKAVSGLNADDITLSGVTGITKGALTGSGQSYALAVGGIKAAGTLTVAVAKSGFGFTNPSRTVTVKYNDYLASGGAASFITVSGVKYELHKFTGGGTLAFDSPSGLTAQVLVVGGGGGAGGATWPSSGAGAGGMVENNAYTLAAASYAVTVGAGGAGGGKGGNGTSGGNSGFGAITAYGGGSSDGRSADSAYTQGRAGGSSGGGLVVYNVIAGTGGTSYGNTGGTVVSTGDTAAGGGGAGGRGSHGSITSLNSTGLYAGAGRANSITGSSVVYAKGGPTTPRPNSGTTFSGISGTANTGNGGGGAWNSTGGNGGSGIVIVRFPAK
jgi:hypothetical protein